MNKKALRIAGWALGLSLAVAGIGFAAIHASHSAAPLEVRAAGKSTTLISTSIDKIGSGTGYAPYDGTHTVNGYSFVSSNVMPNSSKIQFKANSGTLYNSTAFTDGVASVTIADVDTLTVTFGTSANGGCTTAATKTGTSSPWTYTPSVSGTYKYIKIAKTSKNAASTSSIVILEQDTSSPDSISPKAASFNVYNGETLNLSSCVTVTGSGALSFSADKTTYGTITTGVFSASAVGGPTTITATKGSASTTFQINVLATPTYSQLTAIEKLYPGMKVVIGCDTAETDYVVTTDPTSSNKYFIIETASISAGVLTSSKALEFTVGGTVNNWTLTSKNGYLVQGSSGKDLVQADGVSTWTITLDASNNILIANTGGASYGTIQKNDSLERVKPYAADGQTPVQLFVKAEADTSEGHIFSFIKDNMRMGDTALEGNGSGLCKSSNYYSTAKTAFNGAGLTNDERVAFFNPSNAQYAAARARLTKWAAANGEAFDGDNKVLKANQSFAFGNSYSSNDSTIPLLVTVATLGTGAAVGFFLFQRKRREI